MREDNYDRVVYYGRNDSAVRFFKSRVEELLAISGGKVMESVNDAIEAYQCMLIVDGLPELFDESGICVLQESASTSFSRACRFVHTALSERSLSELFAETEMQYAEQFWQLLDKCGAAKKVGKYDLEAVMDAHPECISDILERKGFVDAFDGEIKGALLRHPVFVAELVIGRFASESGIERQIFLPKSLSKDDMDSIMLDYLGGKNPNPNYIGVLANWPSRSVSVYNPSAEVRVFAKRRNAETLEKLFEAGTGIQYGSGVCINMQQKACKGITRDGFVLNYLFGGQWLEAFKDPATIMNNCIYVFDYVDSKGVMQMPARKHEETALVASLGLHAFDEYRTTHAFNMRNDLAVLETIAYADFLERHGTRIESTLEWVYNEYFGAEYGINGFSLVLPVAEASWLDKCKAIGPEIERALKAYVVYSKRGEIDDEYFPYESIKSFADIPSLGGGKYAVAGEYLESWGSYLFSDQSMLAHPAGREKKASSFFDLMLMRNLTRGEYDEYLQGVIDWLIESSLVDEDEATGELMPASRSRCLKLIWDTGAIVLKHYGEYDRNVINELVARNVLSFCSGLFTPDEAAYLNYIFNDAMFSNSLGLRNRYDHAHAAIKDANTDKIRNDYFQLLTILIAITLKINEELMDKTNSGGLEDFVDWPYYDDSVLETAMQLLRETDGPSR